MDPWHAWPSLIGDKSYFDLAQSGDAQDWAIDPVNVLDGSSTSLRDLLIDKAQVHDCTILGVEGPLQYQRQSLVEGVLFGSGRPIILTPMKVLPPTQERILFAWDASPSAVKRQKHIDLSQRRCARSRPALAIRGADLVHSLVSGQALLLGSFDSSQWENGQSTLWWRGERVHHPLTTGAFVPLKESKGRGRELPVHDHRSRLGFSAFSWSVTQMNFVRKSCCEV